MHEDLQELAGAISRRNEADAAIAGIIGRPAEKGHIGEFIAAGVFGIDLEESAAHKGSDRRFADGPLRGRSVNIKFYGKQEGMLDIRLDALPDYFLVLTGPKTSATTSRGLTRPLVVTAAYLFDAARLVHTLRERGLKIGVATSVAQAFWRDAEVYPDNRCNLLTPTDEQRVRLGLFDGQ